MTNFNGAHSKFILELTIRKGGGIWRCQIWASSGKSFCLQMTLKTVPVCKTYNCWQSTQDFMLRLGASGLILRVQPWSRRLAYCWTQWNKYFHRLKPMLRTFSRGCKFPLQENAFTFSSLKSCKLYSADCFLLMLSIMQSVVFHLGWNWTRFWYLEQQCSGLMFVDIVVFVTIIFLFFLPLFILLV